MRRFSLASVIVGAALLPAAACADTFGFSASSTDGGYTGNGTLTASLNADGTYQVTGITGDGITGLLAPNADPIFSNDNLVLPNGSRFLTVEGIAFSTLLNGISSDVNLFSTVSGYEGLLIGNSGLVDATETFNVTTPEPASFALLGSGLLSLAAGAARRRRHTR